MNLLFLFYENDKLGSVLKRYFDEKEELLDFCDLRKEPFEEIYRHSYGALILDGSLPESQLKDLFFKLKESFVRIPVILIHEESQMFPMRSISIVFGNVFFMRFPFEKAELDLLLERVIKNLHTLPQEAMMCCGDLTLDSSTRRVLRSNQKILLRNKEFSLLKFMMENQGRVLTRNDLIDYVWDRNCDIFTNTVDVHVNSLRRKIDRNFPKKLIKTVCGVGYIFDEN